MRLPVLCSVLLLCGCPPNVLRGSIGDADFAVSESVYFELRGVDPGTSLPFHDIHVWMMPVRDPCTSYPQLLDDLSAVRQQLEDGQDPNEFCVDWAAIWADFVGSDPFWFVQLRLQGQPRADDVTPDIAYPYLDSDGAVAPTAPWFDAALARYGAPDLRACAAVFEGTDWFSAVTEVAGGEIDVTRYDVDARVKGTIALDIEGGDPLTGAFDAAFCPSAGEWPLELELAL